MCSIGSFFQFSSSNLILNERKSQQTLKEVLERLNDFLLADATVNFQSGDVDEEEVLVAPNVRELILEVVLDSSMGDHPTAFEITSFLLVSLNPSSFDLKEIQSIWNYPEANPRWEGVQLLK